MVQQDDDTVADLPRLVELAAGREERRPFKVRFQSTDICEVTRRSVPCKQGFLARTCRPPGFVCGISPLPIPRRLARPLGSATGQLWDVSYWGPALRPSP